MPRIKTIQDAVELIGTTWERDGKQRTVTRIEDLELSSFYDSVIGKVYWKRPGGKERKQPQWFPYFNDWLVKAVRRVIDDEPKKPHHDDIIREPCPDDPEYRTWKKNTKNPHENDPLW